MERFTGLEIWFIASIPVFLLLGAIFYLGYKKSCRMMPLILSQLFGFLSVMVLVTLLALYDILPDVVMPVIYLVIMMIFYVGGASLTARLMEAHTRAEYEEGDSQEGGR
ncbi:hypothetical protein [Dethiobacter alkaliphilus]|uniref:Uncharacterized protein n=1 Tax=Dethiobacter alkaliphilus AHT 1 TaxID=555088 RepID=C0GHA4_DETAL|nr:hypothetical protein [Dethiobacter alkaliphilus]EEG77406.1 hypothetical protein DealDRAFT_1863 [Dethiobacter alkaliphilus AHT 1]MCW3490050.1 hypothetical protein [Dethiobacter alkaliphilus]